MIIPIIQYLDTQINDLHNKISHCRNPDHVETLELKLRAVIQAQNKYKHMSIVNKNVYI